MEVTAFPITIEYAANDYYDVSAATALLSITISMNELRAYCAVCSMCGCKQPINKRPWLRAG